MTWMECPSTMEHTPRVFFVNDATIVAKKIQNARRLYVDTETTGLNPVSSRLLMLTVYDGDTVYIIDGSASLEPLKPVFEDEGVEKVFHNAVFDVKFLYHYGITTKGARCTYVAESLLFAGIHGLSMSLEATVQRRLGKALDKKVREDFIHGKEIGVEHYDYAANDVITLAPVYRQQLEELKRANLEHVYELECAIILPTALMEYFGVRMDVEKLYAAEQPFIEVRERANKALQDAFIRAGCAEEIVFTKSGYSCVNVSSPSQMLRMLHAIGVETPSMNAKDLAEYDAHYAEKTRSYEDYEDIIDDEELLELRVGFAHPILRIYATYQVAQKVLSTYIYGLRERLIEDRIYPSYLQLGARATGRYSSRNPNFQNIVKRDKLERIGLGDWDIRSMFIADEGYSFIVCDYSGIELVIAALFSEDETMLQLITSGDIHSYVASHMFNVDVNAENKKQQPYATFRDCAKTLTYAKMYGAGGHNLERSLAARLSSVGIQVHPGDGQKWSNRWDEIFPNAGRFLSQSSDYAVTRGYVTTVLGRRRHWKLPFASKGAYNAARREGSNAPIQGSSADMMKLTIKLLFERLQFPEERIVATIHDEIIVSCPDERAEATAELVGRTMEEAGVMLFPLSAKYHAIRAEPKITKRYDK